MSKSEGISINDYTKQIWGRARANAFAHRVAAERYDCQSKILFFIQLILSLTSLFLIILLYALVSGDGVNPNGKATLLVTLASVSYAMIGLGVGVMQNYMGFEQKFIAHSHNQHSYLYMAQRAREVESPSMSDDKKLALLEDLERDFQILKARGQEPSDRDFRQGHQVLEGVSKSHFSNLQSFQFQKQTSVAATTEETLAENHDNKDNVNNVVMLKVKENLVDKSEKNPCLRMLALFIFLYVTSTGFLIYYIPELSREDSKSRLETKINESDYHSAIHQSLEKNNSSH